MGQRLVFADLARWVEVNLIENGREKNRFTKGVSRHQIPLSVAYEIVRETSKVHHAT